MAEKARKQANPNVMQAIKAIAVLVIICLVCVLLLALCNDLLYIDDDTRLERAMKKVYPAFKLKEEKKIDTANSTNSAYGEIKRVLLSEDGTYVIEALGIGGYQGGTVTLYVVVGDDALIKGWAVKENDKQSYIDRVPSNAGTTWYVGKDVSNELELEMTGATVQLTSQAIKNAVNMAAYYCRTSLGLGENREGEAKEAVLALFTAVGLDYTAANVNKFSGQNVIGTALDGANDTFGYVFVATNDEGTAYAYTFGEGEEIKIVVVKDGSVIAKSTNVTGDEDFVANVLAKPIQEIAVTDSVKLYTFISDSKQSDGKQVYTVVGLKLTGYMPNNYTLTVTIETDGDHGKVYDIAIAENGDGFEPHGPTQEAANKLVTTLKGATGATIDGIYNDPDNGKVAGATESANIITAAVKAALAHYDANLASNG